MKKDIKEKKARCAERKTKMKNKTKTKNTKKQRQAEQIKAHGENLLAIFPNATERDPVKLCKKLRRLEAKAEAICLAYCNGEYNLGRIDADLDAILEKVCAVLRPINVPVFINRDPRGYALKIQDAWMIQRREDWDRQIAKQGKKAITPAYWALLRFHKDWGGYGIIAPEITGD